MTEQEQNRDLQTRMVALERMVERQGQQLAELIRTANAIRKKAEEAVRRARQEREKESGCH